MLGVLGSSNIVCRSGVHLFYSAAQIRNSEFGMATRTGKAAVNLTRRSVTATVRMTLQYVFVFRDVSSYSKIIEIFVNAHSEMLKRDRFVRAQAECQEFKKLVGRSGFDFSTEL